jgi:hypothetical protein
MHARLTSDAATRSRVRKVEQAVADGKISPTAGADAIAALLGV